MVWHYWLWTVVLRYTSVFRENTEEAGSSSSKHEGFSHVFPPVCAILLQLVVGKKSWCAVLLFCLWWLKCFHRAFKYDLLERDSKSEALAWTCIFEVHFLRCNEIWIINCKRKFCTIKLYITANFFKNPVKDCHQICYSYQLTQTEDRLTFNSQGHIVLSQKITK